MVRTFKDNKALYVVIIITAVAVIIAWSLVGYLPIKSNDTMVQNLLGGNLTLAGTLIAVIGILLTILPRNKGSARNRMIMLLFSAVVVMGMSTMVVFLSFIYLGNVELRDKVEPYITVLFISLPLVTIILVTAIPIAYIKANPPSSPKLPVYGMTTILLDDFVALVDQYEMADHVDRDSADSDYVALAGMITRRFGLEKKDNWRTYGAALDSLARMLFSGLLSNYASFAGRFNIPDQDRALVRAAYCHLLAARLLKAHICPKSPSQQ